MSKASHSDLGAFSVSLSVKDLQRSKAFYQTLGFEEFGGDSSQNWLIMKNGPHIIGLFQGMFEGNVLTFNPGWDQDAHQLDTFTDVRQWQKRLEQQGVALVKKTESASGPDSITLMDPDGNAILIDQHC